MRAFMKIVAGDNVKILNILGHGPGSKYTRAFTYTEVKELKYINGCQYVYFSSKRLARRGQADIYDIL